MGLHSKYEIPPNLLLADWFNWMNERGRLQ
jgi:hypothetical protein